MAYDEDLIKNPKGGMPRLIEIMRALRDPDAGCPWDIEQTFATIAPYTIEEAYEVADAIERENWSELRGELGDLLLQSVYHTQMAAEAGLFDFNDVANDISDKMVARHPHVFGDESRDKSADQQTQDWEKIKAAERAAKKRGGVLDDVALGLPALMRAVKLQKRAARVGFDWPDISMVVDKIVEEARELSEAQAESDPDSNPPGSFTLATASVTGTRGSFWPCTTKRGSLILSTLVSGLIFSRWARMAGSRSSPYSTRRRSRR